MVTIQCDSWLKRVTGVLGVREHAYSHHHRHRPVRRHRLPLQGEDAGACATVNQSINLFSRLNNQFAAACMNEFWRACPNLRLHDSSTFDFDVENNRGK